MVKNSRFWHNRQISANFCIFPNFSFRRHGYIFQRKLVLSFSLTHKLLIFYVCEVASIFVHSRLREKRIFWGGDFTSPSTFRQFSPEVLIRGGSNYTLNSSFVITEHIKLVPGQKNFPTARESPPKSAG